MQEQTEDKENKKNDPKASEEKSLTAIADIE